MYTLEASGSGHLLAQVTGEPWQNLSRTDCRQLEHCRTLDSKRTFPRSCRIQAMEHWCRSVSYPVPACFDALFRNPCAPTRAKTQPTEIRSVTFTSARLRPKRALRWDRKAAAAGMTPPSAGRLAGRGDRRRAGLGRAATRRRLHRRRPLRRQGRATSLDDGSREEQGVVGRLQIAARQRPPGSDDSGGGPFQQGVGGGRRQAEGRDVQ